MKPDGALLPAMLIALAAAPASAEDLTCQLRPACTGTTPCPQEAPLRVAFTLDRHQFAPGLHARDPRQRLVTQVDMAGRRFGAEPILTADGATRGFWSDDGLLLIVDDGSRATLSTTDGTVWRGSCEVAP